MFEPPSERWKPFGKHLHRFEPPDLYIVRLQGDVTADEMLVQIDALQTLTTRMGHGVFWLVDASQMGAFTPAARRAAAAAQDSDAARASLRGSAIFGASFATRVVANLLSRAVRVLRKETHRPLAFVETEAEARAFIGEHR